VSEDQQRVVYSADLRYHGQGFEIPVTIDIDAFDGSGGGLDSLRAAFDAEHNQLFSFVLDAEHELVTVRATANGPRPDVAGSELEHGDEDPGAALTTTHQIWIEGGEVEANIYDRGELRAGNVVRGPAIVTEMDSTTLVLPGHAATVHPSGSLLIRPLESNPEN
jgi:N-methylhydantoinase A